MMELIQANWPVVLIAFFIGLFVAWFVFRGLRKTTIETDTRDVLDEGQAPASRNQALIDSEPAATKPVSPIAPDAAPDDAPEPVGKDAEAAKRDPRDIAPNAINLDGPRPQTENIDAKKVNADRAEDKTETSPISSPSPAPENTPDPSNSPSDIADDLTHIKGVGPKLRDLLHSHNIISFEQIAAWTEQDINRVDSNLGRFQGRIRRDNWVEQARLLAKDDTEAYEAKFGKL